MNKTLWLCTLLITPTLQAWDCKFEKQIDQVLDLSGSKELAVHAAAGDLEIRSGDGDDAVIRGKVCASKEEWLEKSAVLTQRGKRAEITVDLPETSGWSITGNNYAYMDLELTVPDHLAVDVKDSSGDAELSGLASLTVSDSSGDLEIHNISGPVIIKDSSGDIELEDIEGDVTVASDSSGDIEGERITGSVLVEHDSSGGIHFSEVGGDFTVERDSSGDIAADGVGGDFTVLRDGSGDIRAVNVTGKVDIPDNS
jgi:DUF4097 and DUF4098 domain-containing protein YvlB